jgi:type II secretory pathway pseudopilin PulG
MPRSAFSLIELMLAMAMSLVIIGGVVMAFRVATQVVTTANRLTVENTLLRAGLQSAYDQLDFWTWHDDPEQPDANRRHHYVGADNVGWPQGLAFAPLKQLPFKAAPGSNRFPIGTVHPRPTAALNDPTWENDVGFDATVANAVHDPRTWYRGNMNEVTTCHDWNNGGTAVTVEPAPIWDNPLSVAYWDRRAVNTTEPNEKKWRPTFLWFGRYALFSNATPGGSASLFTQPRVSIDPSAPDTYRDLAYRMDAPASFRWQPNQQKLFSGAGFTAYAMFDYMPANNLIGYTKNWNNQGGWPSPVTVDGIEGTGTTYGGIDRRFNHADWGFYNSTHNIAGTGGRLRATAQMRYALLHPDALPNNPSDPYAYGLHMSGWSVDWDSIVNGPTGTVWIEYFLSSVFHPNDLLDQRPETWPTMSVAVGHYIGHARFTNGFKLRWKSPLTGEVAELSFTGLGTTLRGARQQRHRDGGWAHWDDRASAINDPTLDTP